MERKRFTIPVVKEDDKTQENETKQERKNDINLQSNNGKTPDIKTVETFVSPIYGSKVKDNTYYPQVEGVGSKKQYDYLKDGQLSEADIKPYLVPSQKEFLGYDPIHRDKYGNIIEENNNYNNVNNNAIQNEDIRNNEPVQKENQGIYESPYQELREEEVRFTNETLNNKMEENMNQNTNQEFSNPELRNQYVVHENKPEIDPKNGLKMGEPGTSYVQANLTQFNKNQFSELEGEEYHQQNDEMYEENRENEESEIDDIAFEEKTPLSKGPQVSNKIKAYLDVSKQKKMSYHFPSLGILKKSNPNVTIDEDEINDAKNRINQTLFQFDIDGEVCAYHKGPTFTLYEVEIGPKVKYQQIPNIALNLQGRLKATSIRIQSPIPGLSTVGIEVPNQKKDIVYFGDLIDNPDFINDGNPLNVVLGKTVTGKPIYLDITNMPHGLIAGCTKSGKSVCINAIINSILYKAHPDDVKLILIDPKIVEFKKYEGIPHLATEVISDPKLAIATMRWLVEEMDNRYELLASLGLTNYKEYLDKQQNSLVYKHIPYILLIIDEFADLMQTGGSEVEDIVKRLTAKARAAGIHLIVATQRPSVDVISGTIKSNLPSRISFKVQKALDSNIILDKPGAEKLLGNGDMLYLNEQGETERIQGSYISTDEIHAVVDSISTGNFNYLLSQNDLVKKQQGDAEDEILKDPRFADITRDIVSNNNASMNRIQKKFGLGFNTAQAIIEKLAEYGVISENVGCKARSVLMDAADVEDLLARIL